MKIQNRFLLSSLAVTLIVLTCATLGLNHSLKIDELNRLQQRVHDSEALISQVLRTPLWVMDSVDIRSVCTSFFQDPELLELALTDTPPELSFSLQKEEPTPYAGQRIERELELTHEGHTLGKLKLVFTTSLIEDRLVRMRSVMVMVTVIISLVLILIFRQLSEAITAPINRLISALSKVDDGDYENHLRMEGHGEFLALERYFNNMVDHLRQNQEDHETFTKEIEQKNLNLETEVQNRKRAEEALTQAQRLETIGRLAGGVAHDFNNLLTAILGYAEMAELDLPGDHPAKESVSEIKEAGERGRDLVQQLLAVGRKKPISPAPVPVQETLIGLQMLISKALSSSIELKIEPGDPSLVMLTDTSALSQILLNLATNARDAMDKGGCLTITAHSEFVEPGPATRVPEPKTYVCIDVADEGHGIPPDKIESVFDPFFSTKGEKGTGLGLAMVSNLVDQLGGGIGIRSEEGVGTTISLFFPITEPAAVRPSFQPETCTTRFDGVRVLLVEDETQVRELVQRSLTTLGCIVTCCPDGTDGLDAFRNGGEFDLIVSDVIMTRMDGPEMIHRARSEGLLKSPVLFITGYGHEQIGELLNDPEICLLPKPFSRSELHQVLHEIFDDPVTSSDVTN